ncbi:hypothetical protein A2U01_0042578, partial [Trifolium medium]|nr:hypothetical protein [Trifolium medium]
TQEEAAHAYDIAAIVVVVRLMDPQTDICMHVPKCMTGQDLK